MKCDDEYLWFKLFCVKGIGPKVMFAIHEKGIPLDKVFAMNPYEIAQSYPELANKASLFSNVDGDIDSEYQRLKEEGIEFFYPGKNLFPEYLFEYDKFDVPLFFFCKWYTELLRNNSIAIVGSRNASQTGLEIANKFAAELAFEGFNIISGYAKGIDTNAHLGALEAGGTTTIVLSYGISGFDLKKSFKNFNPSKNILVVSQFYPAEKWQSYNAMKRNALVCALSQAVIVIESGEKQDKSGKMSGTFAAGDLAMKMKIPLYVVNPECFANEPAGNYQLIEKGANIINSINDIDLSSLSSYSGKKNSCYDGSQLSIQFNNK